MAGSNADFDPAAFRDGIHLAMQLGRPSTPSYAVFHFMDDKTYASVDAFGDPWNWTDNATSDATPDAVSDVPVAVEFQNAAPGNTPVGEFNATKIVITMLDTDYARVAGATHVDFGDATYDIDFVAPPIGLFDVNVFQIYATARDQV